MESPGKSPRVDVISRDMRRSQSNNYPPACINQGRLLSFPRKAKFVTGSVTIRPDVCFNQTIDRDSNALSAGGSEGCTAIKRHTIAGDRHPSGAIAEYFVHAHARRDRARQQGKHGRLHAREITR